MLVMWYIFLAPFDGVGAYIGRTFNKAVNPANDGKRDYACFYDEAADIIFDECLTKIYIRGDELDFTAYDTGKNYNDKVTVEYVDKITSSVISTASTYNIVIYNNISGENRLSDNECKVLNEAAKNKNFTFYFAGEKDFDKLVEHGVFNESAKQDDDICIANEQYGFHPGSRIFMSGIYTKHDDEVMSGDKPYSGLDDCIILNIVRLNHMVNKKI